VHVAVAPVPASMQLWSKVPLLLVVSAKSPVGAIGVPGEMSAVITWHTDGVTTITGLSQVIVVVVDLPSIPKLSTGLVLLAWVVSPP